jgi:enamine deaminase RidA (YjgF/YER057c/UK114 family)
MIHSEVQTTLGYSAVASGGVRRLFAAAVPRRDGSLAEQLVDVLQTIAAVSREEDGLGSIVMQTVFLRHIEDQPACRQIVESFYRKDLPATAYVPQPPCDGSLVAVEAWGIGSTDGELRIDRPGDGTVIVRHDGLCWAHLADVRPETAAGPVYDLSLQAFHSAERRLGRAGLRFEDVVRTWLYLGNITGPDGETQRYCELNRARTAFYQDRKFGGGLVRPQSNGRVFPASTGIGTDGDALALGCIALRTSRADVAMVPLENPRQTSSCDYGRSYGLASPKFSRAMAVVAGDSATTFISGTASITASETRHADSVQRQTEQTLDNIEALIAPENFDRHGLPRLGATLGDLALARVYLRQPEDYATAREICQARLGRLPVIYVMADVCRPELLVEIEAIAFSGRRELDS